MKKNIKPCILLLFSAALIMATPLSIAMNLQEKKYAKIDELRQAYFYLKQSYQKNKDKELRWDNIKNLATYLIHENEKNNYVITYNDVIQKISDDSTLQRYLTHYYLKEINYHHDDSYAGCIVHLLHALYLYYNDLMNTPITPQNQDKSNINNISENTYFHYQTPFSEDHLLEKKIISWIDWKKPIINANHCISRYTALFFYCFYYVPFFFKIIIWDSPCTGPCGLLGQLELSVFLFACMVGFFIFSVLPPIITNTAINPLCGVNTDVLNKIYNRINNNNYLNTEVKKIDPEIQQYFDHLYFKTQNFIEKNKNQEFIKNFEENKKICLQKLLEQEDDFLFNFDLDLSI